MDAVSFSFPGLSWVYLLILLRLLPPARRDCFTSEEMTVLLLASMNLLPLDIKTLRLTCKYNKSFHLYFLCYFCICNQVF